MSLSEAFAYQGSELELFEHAVNWKRYFSRHIARFIGRHVLEVGAGIGGTTRYLLDPKQCSSWTCLEPDPKQVAQIMAHLAPEQRDICKTKVGTSQDLNVDDVFDTVLYMDVIEHIDNDKTELTTIARHVKRGGRIIILAPAHQFLFSPFDAAIGHYRRFTKDMLSAIRPEGYVTVASRYLDSVGFFASSANRYFMKQSFPTRGQLQFWDRVLVPLSKFFDGFLGYNFGKSVLVVWQKT